MGTVIHDAQLARIGRMLASVPRVLRRPSSSSTPSQYQLSTAPLSSSSARVSIGGHKLTGSSPLDGFDLSGGSFFAPTVVEDISVEDELWKEEVFGPVLVVKRFSVSLSPSSSLLLPLRSYRCDTNIHLFWRDVMGKE